MATDTPNHADSRQPPSSLWRPLFILACWVIGMLAVRFIIIDGTIFDQKFTPSWAREDDDLYGVRKALDRADFDQAERILRKLLDRQPRYGAAHERLGYVLLQRDRLKEALEHYRIAAGYHPDDGAIANAIELIERRLKNGYTGAGGG